VFDDHEEHREYSILAESRDRLLCYGPLFSDLSPSPSSGEELSCIEVGTDKFGVQKVITWTAIRLKGTWSFT
jgi:hypothetical protein